MIDTMKISENVKIGNTEYILKDNIPKLLWTNPNPDVSFSAQSIYLSSDDWDTYEVIYKNLYDTHYLTSSKSVKGKNMILFATSGSSQGNTKVREVKYIDQQTIYFNNCANPGVAWVNEYCIPLYIIGYNTKLFS